MAMVEAFSHFCAICCANRSPLPLHRNTMFAQKRYSLHRNAPPAAPSVVARELLRSYKQLS